MELKDNPFLQQEDYFAGYQESIEKLKNNPHIVAFDKLNHELFSSELGKKWLDIIKERYLIPSIVDRGQPNYKDLIIWADGFKDFPRMILQHIMSHDQRIKAGNNT